MWIKIEEGLPSLLQKVLITVENNGTRFVLLAWFGSNKEWQYLDAAGTSIKYKVIAWSPFPKPFRD